MSGSNVTAREIAEALVCIAKLIALAEKLWPDWAATLVELEDELSDLHQEMR